MNLRQFSAYILACSLPVCLLFCTEWVVLEFAEVLAYMSTTSLLLAYTLFSFTPR